MGFGNKNIGIESAAATAVAAVSTINAANET